MSRKSRANLSAVEKLIEQRRLFQEWLTKLDQGIDGMPAHVVERVRNDYRARLTEVTAELAEHEDAVRQALGDAQARHDGLEKQQTAGKDELAELRLRRHVGEVDDARFKEANTRLKATLDELGKELAASLRDIERYEEILDLVAAAPHPAAASAEAPESAEAVAAPAAESATTPAEPSTVTSCSSRRPRVASFLASTAATVLQCDDGRAGEDSGRWGPAGSSRRCWAP